MTRKRGSKTLLERRLEKEAAEKKAAEESAKASAEPETETIDPPADAGSGNADANGTPKLTETPAPSNTGNSIDTPWNPLDEPVEDREYAKPQGEFDDSTPIPEPTFAPPTIDINENPGGEGDPAAQNSEEVTPGEEAPQEDEVAKQEAAEMLADQTIYAYTRLHDLGKWYGKVSEKSLKKRYEKGELSPNISFPVDPEGRDIVTLAEFVEGYNEEVDEAMNVSPDFVSAVRPPLVRVYKKHGWGMKDEHVLALRFVEDFGTKTAVLIGLKKSINAALNGLSESYMRQHAGTPPPPPPSAEVSQVPPAPNPPEPQAPDSPETPAAEREALEPEERAAAEGNQIEAESTTTE